METIGIVLPWKIIVTTQWTLQRLLVLYSPMSLKYFKNFLTHSLNVMTLVFLCMLLHVHLLDTVAESIINEMHMYECLRKTRIKG